MPALTREEYRAKFDKMSVAQVRRITVDKGYNEKHREWADEWLKDKERAEQTQRLERQEERDEKSLTSNKNSNTIAIVSAVVAVAAIVWAFMR
jgi:hypothetical protein